MCQSQATTDNLSAGVTPITHYLNVLLEILFFFRKLGLDLVPRIDDRIVGPDTLGVYQLYNVVSPFNLKKKKNTGQFKCNDILITLLN